MPRFQHRPMILSVWRDKTRSGALLITTIYEWHAPPEEENLIRDAAIS